VADEVVKNSAMGENQDQYTRQMMREILKILNKQVDRDIRE